MGIISGAMSGLGGGAQEAGRQLGTYLSASQLQAEAAEITRLRDDRLEELRRAPGKAAQAKIDTARNTPVDDLSGTMRPRTKSEMAQAEEDAYRSEGLVNEAMHSRGLEQQRERDNQTALDRQADNARADRQLDLSVKNFDITRKGHELDNQIKQYQLANVKRVEDLKKEYASAVPERQKAITEEIQLITGKDNDAYLPVPIKDETGNVTGYRIFDKKRGAWVEDKTAPAPKPGAAGRPSLDAFFGGKKPTAPGVSAPGAQQPIRSTEPPTVQQRREAAMREQYDREQEDKRKSAGMADQEFRDNIDRTSIRSGI